MAVYYPASCDDLVGDHYCDPCEDVEQGRVRSVAFIKTTFTFTDPSDPLEWEAGFASGDIILIPQTRGNFDGGTEVESTGFGNQATRLTGYNFQVQFQDPNYKQNCAFYNALKKSRQYKFAYRTSTQIHMVDYTVQAIPKNPVQDDLATDVVWDVLVKWQGADVPCPHDAPPGIFDACVANY